MNILLIGVWSTLLILVVLVIILLIRTRSGRLSGSAGYGGGSLPRELREEMYRSRQETIGMVQSSVKNMGDMLWISNSDWKISEYPWRKKYRT